MAKSRKMPDAASDVEAALYNAVECADIEAQIVLWADEEDIACLQLMAIHNVLKELKHAESDQQNVHVPAPNVDVKTPHRWRIAFHHALIAPGKGTFWHLPGAACIDPGDESKRTSIPTACRPLGEVNHPYVAGRRSSYQ